MKIRNNDELKRFEQTLDRCGHSVYMVAPGGEQYDLKDPAERYMGIAEMLRDNGWQEPELFATSAADEAQLIQFLEDCEKEIA